MASSRTSDLLTANTAICAGVNRINAVTLITDGTNAATVTVYDNPSAASGKVVAKATASGAQNTVQLKFTNPVYCETGIYAVVSGTGAAYIVHFGG